MTISERFVARLVRCFFLANLILGIFVFSGCGLFPCDIQPTYKEKDIPHYIKAICKDEYGIDVTVRRAEHTIWVYAPQQRILHADFGKNPDKVFDDSLVEKARDILTSISRVLMSADKTPDFFVLVLSDIKVGLDYTITAKVEDIKKSSVGFIPWSEANKRFVIKLEQNPKAEGDKTGAHLVIYDVTMQSFLTRQMAQRIRIRFQEDDLKKYFVLKEAEATLRNKEFILEYAAVKNAEPPQKVNLNRQISTIIAYCIQTYDFHDFSTVLIKDMLSNESNLYTKKDIFSKVIE